MNDKDLQEVELYSPAWYALDRSERTRWWELQEARNKQDWQDKILVLSISIFVSVVLGFISASFFV